jgi:hypothetical protein
VLALGLAESDFGDGLAVSVVFFRMVSVGKDLSLLFL